MKRYWIITLALVLAACGGGQASNFSDPTDRLEVVSWWVSPSEHPAFEVLLNAFKAANPKVNVIDGAIAGGGGSNVQIALAARLRAGDPPDVWRLGRRWPHRRYVRGISTHWPGSHLAAHIARRSDLSGQAVGGADRITPGK
jgi:ABC-type glycerol-3-phosphate transport system substrate-binding protein